MGITIRTTEEKHNYGIDLLRIVVMLMIVAHHFSLHSGIDGNTPGEDLILRVFALGGKTGVNVFVLITGYFSAGKIRREKIGSLIGLATFYSLTLTFLSATVGYAGLGGKMLMKAAFPLFLGDNYWFLVTYLELHILIPVLHKVVQTLDAKTYRQYLIFFACLLSVLPTVVGRFIQVNDFGYSPLVWFVYLYCVGAYLKQYGISKKLGEYIYIYISAGLVFVQIASCVMLHNEQIDGSFRLILDCIADYSANAVFPLLISVFMLQGFKNLTISRNKRLIQLMGSATLGVYLYHDNTNFRCWLWENIYSIAARIGGDVFLVNAVLCVLIVYVLGSLLEISRSYIAGSARTYLNRNKNRE